MGAQIKLVQKGNAIGDNKAAVDINGVQIDVETYEEAIGIFKSKGISCDNVKKRGFIIRR